VVKFGWNVDMLADPQNIRRDIQTRWSQYFAPGPSSRGGTGVPCPPKRVLCTPVTVSPIMKTAVYTVHPDGRDVPPCKQPFRLCTSFLLLLRLLAPVVQHVKHSPHSLTSWRLIVRRSMTHERKTNLVILAFLRCTRRTLRYGRSAQMFL